MFREIMPNLLPFIVASFVGAVGAAMLAVDRARGARPGRRRTMTLGITIYWSQQ